MLFLVFVVPIGLVSGYMCVLCARQKYMGAALLMGGVTAVCAIISLVIIVGTMFVSKTI